MNSSTLPCPYCNNYEMDWIRTKQGYAFTCPKCHATGPIAEDIGEARVAWNSIPRLIQSGLRTKVNGKPYSWWKQTLGLHSKKTSTEKMPEPVCEVCGKPAKFYGNTTIQCPPVREGDMEIIYSLEPCRSACCKEHLDILAPTVPYTHVPPGLLRILIDSVQAAGIGYPDHSLKYLISAMYSCIEGLEKGLEHLKTINEENAKHCEISQTLLDWW